MFIDGKYYKCIDSRKFIYYFKFKCFCDKEKEYIESYYEIWRDEYYPKSFFPKENLATYIEIPISQIIDMLPDNHIDKIVYLRNEKIKLLLT